MAKVDYSKEGIDRQNPPADLPAGFSWSKAFVAVRVAGRRAEVECPGCFWPIKLGQWARDLIGPRGDIHYHDDCVDAIDFERVEASEDLEGAAELESIGSS